MKSPRFESTLPQALTKAENLPSLPAVAVEVLRLCDNEQSTVKDLAKVVQRDPALAVKMLKLANSSLFSLGHPIATVDHAAMVLGMKTVKLMSLSFSLANRLPKDGESNFDYAGFWRRSLVTAVAGRSLAKRERSGTTDEAFLAGLLAKIGQLVLAESLPELYLDVCEAEAPRWPTLEVEKSALGFHSADVAGALISTWNLPDLIGVPVAYSARLPEIPETAEPAARRLAELLSIAAHVADVVCEEDNGVALMSLEDEAERLVGFSPADVEAFLLSLEREIRDTADMLSIEIPRGESHADVVARARGRIVAINLDASAKLKNAEQRADRLAAENRELEPSATVDKPTGLYKREALEDFLEGQLALRRAEGVPRALGLMMLDVDHFQRINDGYGRSVGDLVLARIGQVLLRTTRKADFAARYGGEEFAVVLPKLTPAYLRSIANRIRAAIEAEVIECDGERIPVTVSVGAVCISRVSGRRDAQILLRVADKLLLKAKGAGRNRVETYLRDNLAPPTEAAEAAE